MWFAEAAVMGTSIEAKKLEFVVDVCLYIFHFKTADTVDQPTEGWVWSSICADDLPSIKFDRPAFPDNALR